MNMYNKFEKGYLLFSERVKIAKIVDDYINKRGGDKSTVRYTINYITALFDLGLLNEKKVRKLLKQIERKQNT